jgi:outer membrane protein TolC
VVAARWRVEAVAQDVAVARTGFYPNISLNAFAGVQSIGLGDWLTAGSRMLGIGPAVSLPLFDGGRLRANLALHQAEQDAAVETYNATLVSALNDVVTQLVSLRAVADIQREQAQALTLATQAEHLARERRAHGLANTLQVLAAEGQVLAQQRRLVDTQARQRELRLDLIRALGGGEVPATPTERLLARSPS